MTSNSSRLPISTRSILAAAGGIVLTLALMACGNATEPNANPGKSEATATAPEQSRGPTSSTATVVGNLDVLIALTTPDSVIPSPPLSYALLVQPAGGTVATAYPVDADGTLALSLAPGTYGVASLQIKGADLGTEPVVLPLSPAQRLEIDAPATGCVYGGLVDVTYGRLPAGTKAQQQALVDRASMNNHENYTFVYRPDGGFVMAGMAVSLPAPNQRPAAAKSCVDQAFTVTKA